MSFLLLEEVKSVKLSDVGSGPLVHPERFSFRISTLHPISFNNSGANPFAAPPPISTTIFGLFSILPMIFLASSMYDVDRSVSTPIFFSKTSANCLFYF